MSSSKNDLIHVELVANSALASWTSLQLSIQHGFVEGDTTEKLAQLTDDLKSLCMQNTDQLEIEDLLESSAYHDFNFIDEDGSFKDLAKAIVTCLAEMKCGHVTEIVSKHFPSAAKALKMSMKSENEDKEVEHEAALSEMISETRIKNNELLDDNSLESNTLECNTMEDRKPWAKPRKDPIIDEDGFELVQSRRRRQQQMQHVN